MDTIQVITGVERRRRYSAEEKVKILEEALSPGSSVLTTARQYKISPSVIHLWKKTLVTDSRRKIIQKQLPAVSEAQEFVRIAEDSGDVRGERPIYLHAFGEIVIELPSSIAPKTLAAFVRAFRP